MKYLGSPSFTKNLKMRKRYKAVNNNSDVTQYKKQLLFALMLLYAVNIFFTLTGSHTYGKIAFTSTRDGTWEIYTMDANGRNIQRITNNAVFDGRPAWSPDGKKIAFTSDRDGTWEIYTMDADRSNVQQLTHSLFFDLNTNPDWCCRILLPGEPLPVESGTGSSYVVVGIVVLVIAVVIILVLRSKPNQQNE